MRVCECVGGGKGGGGGLKHRDLKWADGWGHGGMPVSKGVMVVMVRDYTHSDTHTAASKHARMHTRPPAA